ncbi:MAG: MotA/TolQ/ExbB proton channel family protein [Elusimicrobia bacterium]|nr:MotA/TolQ/ExbB proton channel family protein [Elusimicrobiota bacterium]
MFSSFTLKSIFIQSWPIVSLLLLLSIACWAIILERWFRFRKSSQFTTALENKVKTLVKQKKLSEANSVAVKYTNSLAKLYGEILKSHSKNPDDMERMMFRSIRLELEDLNKNLVFLGTVGSTTPFIGLFGTVIGIIKAFKALSLTSSAGPAVVANGISEALVNTALGLFVAIPAVVAYNFFINRIKKTATILEVTGEDLIDRLEEK